MSIFDFEKDSLERIGVIESVDTANIVIKIENEEKLKRMQVNHLVVVQSSKVGQHLIALVNKIMRNSSVESVEVLKASFRFMYLFGPKYIGMNESKSIRLQYIIIGQIEVNNCKYPLDI